MPSDRDRPANRQLPTADCSDRGVAGIVLAAGASVRMGRNKMFFELGGEPLLHRAARRAIEARLEPVIVVVGHEAERAIAAVSDLRCAPIVNADYASGINSSVRAGIRAVPPHVEAAVVVLADMPLVSSAMIATLVERYRDGSAALVVSRYGDVNAPPTLYGRVLFGELLALEGEGCGKHVVKRHRDEAVMVSWPPDALTDLDVPEEYDRVRAFIEEGTPLHAH
jgi:molybdenum cofactor cytidylyltransferase